MERSDAVVRSITRNVGLGQGRACLSHGSTGEFGVVRALDGTVQDGVGLLDGRKPPECRGPRLPLAPAHGRPCCGRPPPSDNRGTKSLRLHASFGQESTNSGASDPLEARSLPRNPGPPGPPCRRSSFDRCSTPHDYCYATVPDSEDPCLQARTSCRA